jgi:hypothetical protein
MSLVIDFFSLKHPAQFIFHLFLQIGLFHHVQKHILRIHPYPDICISINLDKKRTVIKLSYFVLSKRTVKML